MVDNTSYSDFIEWYQNTGESWYLKWLKVHEIKNNTDASGNLNLPNIKDLCPIINGEYEAVNLVDGNNNKISVRLASVEDVEYQWLDDIYASFCISMKNNTWNSETETGVMFKCAFSRPVDTTNEGHWCVKVYLNDTLYNTLETWTYDWNIIDVNVPIDELGNDIICTFYANRAFVEGMGGTYLTRNDYGTIVRSHNLVSQLRAWEYLNHLIEGAYEPEEGKNPSNSYYFFNKTYDNTNTLVRSIKGEYGGVGRICGYVSSDEPYNIRLVYDGNLKERLNDETAWHTPTLPRLTSNDTIGKYYGLLDTNIPLFSSLADTTDYLLHGNTDNALNQSDLDKSAKTGMDGTEARFERANTYDIRAVASRILDVSEVHSDIIQWMESLNDPSVSETIDMFWWTNNPIECLTAYYWSPLDMSEIGRTLPHSANLVKFGGVVAKNVDTGDEISATPLNAQGTEILLGQYQFNRKYNDWRDYTLFNYKLYLPFYGLVDLEPYYITGKRLEVKYVYYPTNHTIRYMIFVKQNLYKAIDCSVGIDLPMTSSDAVGKAQKNFSDALSIPSDVKSITEGNVIGGITSIIGKGLEMSKKPSLLTWGSINPTTNIGDPLQAMLYIEEQQTIIPNKLYETYGHANYYIGSIGALSGYCEFSDVRLTGCDTLSDNEKEELKELLKKGVML